MAHSPTVVVRVVKVVTPGPAVEEAAVGGVERKVVPGVALHRLPLPQRREAHQGDEVRAHQERGQTPAGEDVHQRASEVDHAKDSERR